MNLETAIAVRDEAAKIYPQFDAHIRERGGKYIVLVNDGDEGVMNIQDASVLDRTAWVESDNPKAHRIAELVAEIDGFRYGFRSELGPISTVRYGLDVEFLGRIKKHLREGGLVEGVDYHFH